MGLNLEYIYGQTPLDEEELADLKIPTISTRGELDEFEQQNIERAVNWIYSEQFTPETVVNEPFIRDLHFRMFGNVWKWAGKYRLSNKNIGVDKTQIITEIKKLLDDCLYWINNKSYSEDEIAIRFKVKLVKIHPFPNGNGRHSRLMADIIIYKLLNRPMFSWGSENITAKGDTRNRYIQALLKADKGEYQDLLSFARS